MIPSVTELKIEGMTCDHCVETITNALNALNDVNTVTINLEKGHATIVGDAKADELIAAIGEAGYTATVK